MTAKYGVEIELRVSVFVKPGSQYLISRKVIITAVKMLWEEG